MKSTPRLFTCFAAVLCSVSAAYAQAPTTAPAAAAGTPSSPILQTVQRFQANFMAAAQAMPADKFSFAPSDAEVFKAGSPAKFATVRTFAQQLTHVTHYTYQVFAAFSIKPDVAPDLTAIDALTDKDAILKALQASFDYENKIVSSMTADSAFAPTGPRSTNLVAALVTVLSDDGDHYGQMVEYLRMNGIIPPSTERQAQQQAKPATAPAK